MLKKIKSSNVFKTDTKVIRYKEFYCLIKDIEIYKLDKDYLIKINHLKSPFLCHSTRFYEEFYSKCYDECLTSVEKCISFTEYDKIPDWFNRTWEEAKKIGEIKEKEYNDQEKLKDIAKSELKDKIELEEDSLNFYDKLKNKVLKMWGEVC